MSVRTVAITGAASGLGKALRARLERDGARVIGVDIASCEISADLSAPGVAPPRSRASAPHVAARSTRSCRVPASVRSIRASASSR